ncbi:DUF1707 SHOCT-like domain-containing protein [Nocardioides sp. Iso805N]|uniref:DUF1707 SHOCT-like domain-containing protein n=1 Tax=Nocardioides sp. Iso805N TaxID=1283287 RepID=UPI0003605CA4|nr:DUF1707 domain-containing protein [Nocardioides sp. Iso805N]
MAGAAALRASDADRDVVQTLLSNAYADGRLTPVEHGQRAAALARSRTLGDLRGLVVDLVPEWEDDADDHVDTVAGAGSDRGAEAPPSPDRSSRWRRLPGFLVPSAACVLLWRFAAHGLFWPLWVILYTGLPLLWPSGMRLRRR